jgi:AcrR family transcriptional regulator
MSTTRAVRARQGTSRAAETRQRIVDAVAELLGEGTFHSASTDEVADRAGIARATLYLHFPSRLDLVDAVCERFAVSPALLAIREACEGGNIRRFLVAAVAFWSADDAVFTQFFGAAAVDPAAGRFVERQRADQRGELRRLTTAMQREGTLRPGLDAGRAAALLMVLTSYEAYRELREQGLSDKAIVRTLQNAANQLVTSEK